LMVRVCKMRMNHKEYVVERQSKSFSKTLKAFTLKQNQII